MSREHVNHADLARFADERVNLKREDATDLRAQANRLRDRLETYLADHPDFALRKMLLSGSLAKGTALKSISDIDVGCYVSSDSAPEKIADPDPVVATTALNAMVERIARRDPAQYQWTYKRYGARPEGSGEPNPYKEHVPT